MTTPEVTTETSEATPARLACSELSGGYGTTTAFRDVDLAIQAGTIEALLGPNGAGKTTLLLTMAGFLPPHAGVVTVDGKPLKGGRPSQANKAGVVLVPDNRNLFTTLTVEENLKAARHKGGPSPRDMLEVFPDLEKRWTLRSGALSGGEQQMLAMARALIQEPNVLLIDEMSMGLAPAHREVALRHREADRDRPRMRRAPRRTTRQPRPRSRRLRLGSQPRLDRVAGYGQGSPRPSRALGSRLLRNRSERECA